MWEMGGDKSTTAAGAGSAAEAVLKLVRLVFAGALACVLLAVAATTASAAPSHKFVDRVALLSNSGAGGVAVTQSSGDLYVLDAGQSRVLHLGPTGTLLGQFWAGASPDAASAAYSEVLYDRVNDDVLLVDRTNFGDRPVGAIDRFDADGTFISQINASNVPSGIFTPWGAGVDPTNGDVYVADLGSCLSGDPTDPPSVYVFNSSGVFQSRITGTGTEGELTCPTDAVLDGSGHVYVNDNGPTVRRFSTAGVFDKTVYSGGAAGGMGIDATSDEFYLIEGNRILQYDADGNQVSAFGSDVLGGPAGLAVKESTQRVYAAEGTSVPFFDPIVTPDVTTDAPSAITSTGGTLNGTVNPQGNQTSYHFEWGTDTNYGQVTADVDAGSGTSPVAATEPLTGLLPNTPYHYRLVAADGDGTFPPPGDLTSDQTFTTLTTPPAVSGESSSDIRAFSAKLNATVNPNNAATTYRFEWGTDTSYGNSVPLPADPAGDAGADMTDHAFSAALSDLTPSTVYHWRITANNGVDPQVNGADQTFTAAPPPPSLTTDSVDGITTTSARFHATVDTKGLAGTYHFTVTAENSSYTDTTTPIDIGAAAPGGRSVAASLAGLPPGSPLHVRAVIVTAGGSATTDTLDFKTLDLPPFVQQPLPPENPHPYGCVAPHLNAYKSKAKAGKVITLTGSDLGVGGVATFGSTEADTPSWSVGSVRAQVPSGAKGTVSVTLNCGTASNAISLKIAKKKIVCKKGYVKKKVKGKTRCVKKKKHHKKHK